MPNYDFDFQSLLDAIQRQESSYNRDDPTAPTKQLPLVNPDSGARGQMQVKPSSAIKPGYAEFGAQSVFDVAEGLFPDKQFERTDQAARDLLDIPEVNRAWAENYMMAMLERFDGNVDQAVGAYNAGPGRMLNADRKYENLPEQTQEYINNVRQYYNQSTGDNYGITVAPRPQGRPQAGSLGMTQPQARPKGLLG